MAQHKWIPAQLGHSNLMCQYCSCTPREAAFALGMECPKAPAEPAPIDVVLFCPVCKEQHIDAAEVLKHSGEIGPAWTNPPHKSHLCHHCGAIWRPADVPTNGVRRAKTRGAKDTTP